MIPYILPEPDDQCSLLSVPQLHRALRSLGDDCILRHNHNNNISRTPT